MIAKDNKVFDSDDVGASPHIFVTNIPKDFKLYKSLLRKIVFVPYYFQSSQGFTFVIKDFYNLTKGTSPDGL
jgi:hypothetical protein